MYIFNYFKNEPKSYPEQEASSKWFLRIQGKILKTSRVIPLTYSKNYCQPLRKFSYFFRQINILFKDENDEYKDITVRNLRSKFKWKKQNMASETDGFEIQRPGNRELDIIIQLHLYNNPHKFKCSKKLESVIGQTIATRTSILAGIWEYIKVNRLQDQESREIINCDSRLKDLFGCEKLPINHILAKIKGQLSNPDPIEISHKIRFLMNIDS